MGPPGGEASARQAPHRQNQHDHRVCTTQDRGSRAGRFGREPTVQACTSACTVGGCGSAGGVGLGDQAKPPGNGVVVAVGAGGITLVEVLDLAGADGERLVITAADHLAAAEVLGPRGAAEVDVAGRDEGCLLYTSPSP